MKLFLLIAIVSVAFSARVAGETGISYATNQVEIKNDMKDTPTEVCPTMSISF